MILSIIHCQHKGDQKLPHKTLRRDRERVHDLFQANSLQKIGTNVNEKYVKDVECQLYGTNVGRQSQTSLISHILGGW